MNLRGRVGPLGVAVGKGCGVHVDNDVYCCGVCIQVHVVYILQFMCVVVSCLLEYTPPWYTPSYPQALTTCWSTQPCLPGGQ